MTQIAAALSISRPHLSTASAVSGRTGVVYNMSSDEDTLARMFPKESTAKIQDWFEREPSVRDPSAAYFRVRPMIREKMLRYLEVRSPSRHRQLTTQAAAIASAAQPESSLSQPAGGATQ